jgi:hypothetical protein
VQQVVSAERLARLARQHAQQVEVAQRQVDLGAADTNTRRA